MTEEEKAKVFYQCYERQYFSKEFAPILSDIYDMIKYEVDRFLGYMPKDQNAAKYIDKLFQFYKFVIDNNYIDLFHKMVNKIINPKSDMVSCDISIDLLELLIDPYAYCHKDNIHFTMIIDYLVSEEAYDFCMDNSNSIFYYGVANIIDGCKNDTILWRIGQLLIWYLLSNNIEVEKAKAAIDYYFKNGKTIDSYFMFNYNKNHPEEFMNRLMEMIFNEMDMNRVEIK